MKIAREYVAATTTNSYEYNANFQEWVEFNDIKCSDMANWHYKLNWTRGTPDTVSQELGTGHMVLPEN